MATIEGYLWKQPQQGLYRKWRRRYFLLEGKLLCYYLKAGAASQRGTIYLHVFGLAFFWGVIVEFF